MDSSELELKAIEISEENKIKAKTVMDEYCASMITLVGCSDEESVALINLIDEMIESAAEVDKIMKQEVIKKFPRVEMGTIEQAMTIHSTSVCTHLTSLRTYIVDVNALVEEVIPTEKDIKH